MHMRMPCTHAHVCVHARPSYRDGRVKCYPRPRARGVACARLLAGSSERHQPDTARCMRSSRRESTSLFLSHPDSWTLLWTLDPLELCGVSALELDTDTLYLGRMERWLRSITISASSGFTRCSVHNHQSTTRRRVVAIETSRLTCVQIGCMSWMNALGISTRGLESRAHERFVMPPQSWVSVSDSASVPGRAHQRLATLLVRHLGSDRAEATAV